MVVRADGVELLLLAGATLVILFLVGIGTWRMHRDIAPTRKRDVAEQSQRDRRAFEALVRHTSDVLLLALPGRGVTFANPSARRLFGADPTGWSLLTLLRWLHPNDQRAALRLVGEGLRSHTSEPMRIEARLRLGSAAGVDGIRTTLLRTRPCRPVWVAGSRPSLMPPGPAGLGCPYVTG